MMQPGFACLETGFVRSKNTINVAAKNFTDFVLACFCFACLGYGVMFGTSILGLFGWSGIPAIANSKSDYHFLFQMLFCGTTATIISGAVAERMSFYGYVTLTLIASIIIYPTIGHWIWNNDGWLAQLGAYDFAGATVVHSTGGWAALAAILVIGPRKDRFDNPYFDSQVQNFPFAMLGVFLLWIGWIGFNGGSSLSFTTETPKIILNTLLGGIGGAMIPLILTAWDHQRVKFPLVLYGTVAGLVSVTATTPFMTPFSAIAIGFIGGGLCVATDKLIQAYRIDDGIGVISSHLTPGIFSTLLVPFFANSDVLLAAGGFWPLLSAQLLVILATAFWAFGANLILFRAVDRYIRLRVPIAVEVAGLNEAEHGIISEFAGIQKQIEQQIHAVDMFGNIEARSDSELGKIIKKYNKAMALFRKKQEQWLSDLAHRESQNDLLKTRTTDLEAMLVERQARLNEANAKMNKIMGLLDRAIEVGNYDITQRTRLIGRISLICAESLRKIKDQADRTQNCSKPRDLARSISKIGGLSHRLVDRLETLKTLVNLEVKDRLIGETQIDINDLIETIIAEKQETQRIKAVKLTLQEDLPLIVGEPGLVSIAIERVIESAILRHKNEITATTKITNEGICVIVTDDGQPVPERGIEVVTDPWNSMLNQDNINPLKLDLGLGLTRRIAHLHKGSLSIKNRDEDGIEFFLKIPQQRIIAPAKQAS